MSGSATFTGTTYQAGVIAAVYCHILAQARLGWFPDADDRPVGVAGETGGAGDDIRVEFGGRLPVSEAQAKHGLTGGERLREAVSDIVSRSLPGDTSLVALVVDRGTSATVHRDFAADLRRIRSGLSDNLRPVTIEVVNHLGENAAVLERLTIVKADVLEPQDPERKFAEEILGRVLIDPSQSAAAWDVLVADAGQLCAQRLRRTRKELVDLLRSRGIAVQAATEDLQVHQQLDFTRSLLHRRHHHAVLKMLDDLDRQLSGQTVDARIRYRIAQQRASAFLAARRPAEALISARRALDVDSDGVHALRSATAAAIAVGDLSSASEYADRAISTSPEDPLSWSAAAEVAAARGVPLPEPPQSVRESQHYREAVAELAALQGDWDSVMDLTASLLADGIRSDATLFYRAQALLLRADPADADGFGAAATDAERLASELIELLDDEANPLTPRALTIRSEARRRLARVEEADIDLAAARQLEPGDPDVLRAAAAAKVESGDIEGALRILREPAADSSPVLRVMRANLLVQAGDTIGARSDLEEGLRRLADSPSPDAVRMIAADVAFDLGDQDLATSLVDGVGPDTRTTAEFALMEGRLAIAVGDYALARSRFLEAAARDPLTTRRPQYLTELGVRFLQADQAGLACAAFEEIGEPSEMPRRALQPYATALMQTDNLEKIQVVAEVALAFEPVPAWALAAATNVALRREDPDSAIAHLSRLVEGGDATNGAQIELSRQLIEAGQPQDALRHLDRLAGSDLDPIERMQVAQLLQTVHEDARALPLAFSSYRQAPQDPRINRAFASMVLTTRAEIAPVDAIAADTHVTFRDAAGANFERTIYADGPVDPLRNELTTQEAERLGLLDARPGDEIVVDRGWQEKRWSVISVAPAIAHAAQDVVAHFGERFPDEPFFAAAIHIGDGDSVKDFAPLIASLEERRDLVHRVLQQYREQGLPLGFLVRFLGASVPEVMDVITNNTALAGPLLVEWQVGPDHDASRLAATSAQKIVVTRSGLKTAYALGLLGSLSESFEILGPRTLLQELRSEVADAREAADAGRSTIVGTDSGPRIIDVAAGHPDLLSRLEESQTVLDWLAANANVLPRPLAFVHNAESPAEEVRQAIGASSYDAVTLAVDSGATLHSDDAGLRRFAPEAERAASFSTVSLLDALAGRGILAASDRDDHLIRLAVLNYAVIEPSPQLLERAVRTESEVGRPAVLATFALLSSAGMNLAAASEIGARIVKLVVISPLAAASLEAVCNLVLDGMTKGWPRNLAVQGFVASVDAELRLLPNHLDAVRRAASLYRVGRRLIG